MPRVAVLVPPGGYPDAFPLGAALFERRLRALGYRSVLVDLNRRFFSRKPRFAASELAPLKLTPDGLLTPPAEARDAPAALSATDPESLPPALKAWLDRALREESLRDAPAFFLSASLPTQVHWAFLIARRLKSAFPERAVCGGGSSWSYAMGDPAARRLADSLGIESPAGSDDGVRRLMGRAGVASRVAVPLARLDLAGMAKGVDAVYQLGSGCSYGRCAFCYFPYAGVGASSPASRIIERDLRDLIDAGRSRRVFFCDAYLSPDRIEETLAMVRRVAKGTEVSCFTRFDKRLSDRDLLKRWRAEGLADLYIGLESGSPRVLALMRKGIDLTVAGENIRALHDAGIRAHLSVIVGFPTETRAEAGQTLDFLRAHRPWLDVRPVLFGYTLDAGTPMAQDPRAFGIRRVLASRSIFYPCREVESEGGLGIAEKRELLRAANARLDRSYRSRGVTQGAASLGEQTEIVTGGVL